MGRGTERSPGGWSVNKILERVGRKMWWLNLVESDIFATVLSIKYCTAIYIKFYRSLHSILLYYTKHPNVVYTAPCCSLTYHPTVVKKTSYSTVRSILM